MVVRTQLPRKEQAVADMSQYSIESGRNDIIKQLENMQKERKMLCDRKIVLEKKLFDFRIKHPRGLAVAGEHINRKEIVGEITGIQKRLSEIKPNLHKLTRMLHRQTEDILEDILVVLKKIDKKLANNP